MNEMLVFLLGLLNLGIMVALLVYELQQAVILRQLVRRLEQVEEAEGAWNTPTRPYHTVDRPVGRRTPFPG